MAKLQQIHREGDRMRPEWQERSNRGITEAFEEVVEAHPDREALVFQDKRLTYAQVQKKVNDFAKGLLKLRIKHGDHVAIWSTNNLEWIYACFAILKLGATVVPMNSRFRAAEAEYAIRQSDATTLIFRDCFLGKTDTLGIVNQLFPEIKMARPGSLVSEKAPMLRNIICISDDKHAGMFNFEDIVQLGAAQASADELEQMAGEVSPDDVAYVMYTSGTTGFPKGAMIPHRNMLVLLYLMTAELEITENSKMLCIAPLYSNFGFNGSVLNPILRGASVVILETFDAEEVLETIEREQITHTEGVPSMLIMMLEHPQLDKYDLKSWQALLTGGAPVPSHIVCTLINKVGLRIILNCYGMVEGTGIATWTGRGTPPEAVATTVGRILPYCEVKVVDPNTGVQVADGTEGEIWSTDNSIPRAHVMKGYYNMPKETSETIKDGWLRTGDIGFIDSDGYLRVTGRVKDMILVGAFNVFPAEIEAALYEHPKVKQVSVIGVPDHRLGEVPMAFIELKEGESSSEAEIIAFCRDRMANIKAPRYIKFTKEFPTTAVGKIQKFKLKEIATKELGL